MTSTLVPALRSSARRDCSGFPGGCSGNASASTPRAPAAAAVRHATRAPLLRPPWTSGTPPYVPQPGDDLQPRRVLADRRSRRPGAAHPVGLQDPGHRAAEPDRGVPRGQQVTRVRAAARPVREHHQERPGPGCPLRLAGPSPSRSARLHASDPSAPGSRAAPPIRPGRVRA